MATARETAGAARHNDHSPDRLVAVIVVIFTVGAGGLSALFIKRSAEPAKEQWSLPGGRLAAGESLLDAATRRLEIETGVKDVFLEQLYTFSDLDESGSVAVAYWALVDRNSVRLASRDEWQPAWHATNDLPPLAFHNDDVIQLAIGRLRNKLAYSNVAYSLLPEQFTLSRLQQAYEAILSQPLDKRNFRKRILSLGILEATGKQASEGRHRPAALYRFRERRPVVF